MESQFYQINLLKIMGKWKWHLLVIIIIASVFAAVFSGPRFITPKYKSLAVVYPANIFPYSDENETEQMMQLLNSLDITNNVIDDLELGKHYGLNPEDKKYTSLLYYTWGKNVSVSKTPNDAITIEVFDTDPQMAARIVEQVLHFYNLKVGDLHKKKFEEVVLLYERAMIRRQAYMDSLQNRLTTISKEYNLLDYESQSQEVTEGLLKTLDGSGANHVNNAEVSKLKKNLEEKGGEILMLTSLIESEGGQYAILQMDYERAMINYDREFTYYNSLTSPFPADSKAKPVRYLIVLIAALAAFLLSFFVILFVENRKHL